MLKKRNKFRTKIFKFFIMVSIIPLIVISVSNVFIIILTRQQNIIELNNFAVDNASEKIRKFLSNKLDSFNLVLNYNPTHLIELDTNTSNFLIDGIRAKAGNINEISFIDKSGVEVVKRSDFDSELNDVSGEDYFIQASKNKKYLGDVLTSPESSSMIMASQIENKNHDMIGIISAEVDLSPIQEIIDGIKLGNDGYVIIADNSNSTFFGPTGVDLTDMDKNLKLIPRVDNDTSDYKTFNNTNGEQIIYNSRDVGMAGWKVYTYWPKSDAYKVVNNLLLQSYIILFTTLVFVIILSLIAAKQIVKPIEILGSRAKKIAEGDLDQHIELKTDDEFEILGEEFNNMTEVLKENKKLKDEFVFIAAHELRTPVTAIKGYVSMLLDGTYGEIKSDVKESLKIVYGANERLVQLVQDLLEIARSESGKMKIELKSLPLVATVATVINELRSLAEPKGIKITYNKPDVDFIVMADEIKLKEVLVNLIGNAIKYTIKDDDIEISHEIRDDRIVATHIKDHGLGIDKENLQKLFSKFFRVKTKETSKIEGTGLGLFICKEIIERMGGTIWATSDEGKGSTFSFTLAITDNLTLSK